MDSGSPARIATQIFVLEATPPSLGILLASQSAPFLVSTRRAGAAGPWGGRADAVRGTKPVWPSHGPLIQAQGSARSCGGGTAVAASGSTAAVVELDRMYTMLDDSPVMSDPGIARLARRSSAALVNQYVPDGVNLVIADGDF